MGSFVSCFNAHMHEDNADRHEGHEEAATSTPKGEGAETGKKSDLAISCLASSPYTSSRIQRMLESRNNFTDKISFDIESSISHWTELDPLSDSDAPHLPESDRLYFEEVLKKHTVWGRSRFFRDFDYLEVHEKLAKGAQGEIYYARDKNGYCRYVLKVFKEGYPLRLIQQQMPLSMFFHAVNYDSLESPLQYIMGGTILKDERLKNRFAFVMELQWCDLRKLIDDQMMRKDNQGPPLTIGLVTKFMLKIASDMVSLHYRYGIIHKDLKASNVLVTVNPLKILYADVGFGSNPVVVADFESSNVGVVGTKFWRAPEILRQLKDQKRPVKISMECDVYSFAMLGYELVTGHIPFEDHPPNDYDVVLSGGRPELPIDLDPSIKDIITRCWHQEPSKRPDFIWLQERLCVLLSHRQGEEWVNAKYEDFDNYCTLNNIEDPARYCSIFGESTLGVTPSSQSSQSS